MAVVNSAVTIGLFPAVLDAVSDAGGAGEVIGFFKIELKCIAKKHKIWNKHVIIQNENITHRLGFFLNKLLTFRFNFIPVGSFGAEIDNPDSNVEFSTLSGIVGNTFSASFLSSSSVELLLLCRPTRSVSGYV